ncbi:MAG: putative quinol monooxygenase [Candidatus Acidiferrales bacterium]
MSDSDIILNVHMDAVPGREQDLARELQALVVPTRKEPGCLAYDLHRDPENPGKLMFYEKFKSQAALDEHVNAPYFQKFLDYRAKSDPVATVTVTKWRVVG